MIYVILYFRIISTFPLLSNVTFFLFSLFFTFNSPFRLHWLLLLFFSYSWVLFLFIAQLNPCSFPFLPLFSPTILSAIDIHSFNIFPKIFRPCSVGHNPTKEFQSAAKPPPLSPKNGKNSHPHHPTKPHPLHLVDREPYSLTWLGCRRAKPKHYLTHLPCYFFLFSDFGFFLLRALSVVAAFVFFPHVFLLGICLASLAHPCIQKDMGLYGSNTLYSIKRVFDPICPNLLKSFC